MLYRNRITSIWMVCSRDLNKHISHFWQLNYLCEKYVLDGYNLDVFSIHHHVGKERKKLC